MKMEESKGYFFIISQSEPKKEINYRQKDDSSSTFMSVKKTSFLDNLFTFRESEKTLTNTLLGFLFMMNGFYEPEKKRNWLKNLILGLKRMIKVSK